MNHRKNYTTIAKYLLKERVEQAKKKRARAAQADANSETKDRAEISMKQAERWHASGQKRCIQNDMPWRW